MSDDLIKRLEITGQMISLGERISWGVDSALMAEAAAALAAKDAEIARLRAWRGLSVDAGVRAG